MGQKDFYDGKGEKWDLKEDGKFLTSLQTRTKGGHASGWGHMCTCVCVSVDVASLCADEFVRVFVWMGVRPCV